MTNTTPSTIPEADPKSAAIRCSLEWQLQEREDALRNLGPYSAPNIDPVAWMTAAATRRVRDQIIGALERLSDGTYGKCTRCNQHIPAARLEVLPYAENCIDCQSHATNA